MVGEYGGSAFLLVYLAAVLVIATPVLMSEVLVGRHGQLSPPGSMQRLAAESGASKHWRIFGYWGLLAGFLIMSFYSVIAGWAMAYFPRVASGSLTGLDANGVGEIFDDLLASPIELMAWQGLFIAASGLIVIRGVKRGIEVAVNFLMPSLFIMLLIFMVYSMVTGDLGATVEFLLVPDFSKLTPLAVMAGIGQALFSLSVGFGAMMTYGAYLDKSINIPRSAATIAIVDTLVALAAGFAIFPIVFANGLDPSEGPGLIFISLTTAFAQMPGGAVFGTLFFTLLVFAALTTAIGFLEPIVAWLLEEKGISRAVSVIILCLIVWIVGLATVFSFNIWSNFHLLGAFETFADKTPFDLIDYLITNIMQPAGALMLVIFVGWKADGAIRQRELDLDASSLVYRGWLFSLRFLAPSAILILFLIGVLL
jgi:neurotransmitter:Na+ symporter, NSS family